MKPRWLEKKKIRNNYLKGMKIPKIYPITPATQTTEELIASLEKLNKNKLNIFLYRRKTLNKYQIKNELSLEEKVCQQDHICLILNSFHGKELVNKFSGFHLTNKDAKKENRRPINKDKLLGISCHSEDDILKAESLEPDYIFLSPIKETSSHKDLNGLGWLKFSQWTRTTNLPTYALGGLGMEDLKEAESYGAYGIAGISNFWPN